MSSLTSRPLAVATGIYVYLCSGEVMEFPTATSVDLIHGVFEVRSSSSLLASVRQDTVWSWSLSETSPSLG